VINLTTANTTDEKALDANKYAVAFLCNTLRNHSFFCLLKGKMKGRRALLNNREVDQ